MRRKYLLLSALILMLMLVGCATTPYSVDPRTLSFAPLKFSIPKSDRITLKNGMKVYLFEDHELPIVNMTTLITAGSVYDPPELTALAGLAGSLLRSGGIESLKPDQLDAELEFMASSIESGIGEDLGTLSMSTLKKNLDRTLELYADVLMKPGFEQSRVELAKNNMIEAIRRQNDDPKGIAGREFTSAIYENHPLGRVATIESVSRITRQDMVALHKKYFTPKGMILAVSGDFDRKELLAKLEKLFGDWQPQEPKLPTVALPEVSASKQVLLAKKPVSQSVIRMGHLGLEKNNPDQYAVRVMDYILGGGFTSRLMQQIRSDRGLAYNAGSYFEIGRRFPGIFQVQTETKAESTVEVINLIRAIISGMTQELVSEEELHQAKESIINSFIFGFARADSIVTQQARLAYYDFPAGYLENFRDNIAKVTRDDILRVSRKYLHPEAMTILVVGDDKKFDQPLSSVGTVREIKLETFKKGGK
jgi:predicted Zn-dependent peptidase